MSTAFGRSIGKDVLDGIKDYLKNNDAEFKWAIESKDFTVYFKTGDVATSEEAWGTTQILVGGEDLGAAIMRNVDKVARLLRNPQPLRVEITIDNDILSNQGTTIIALAHEIGVHLKPRLAFIRKVVDQGGITNSDLAGLLATIEKEHPNAFHARSGPLPPNPTYLTIILAFASLITDQTAKQQFLDTYFEDTQRYDPQEHDEDFIVGARARQISMEETLKKLGVIVGGGLSLLIVVAAILVAYSYSK
jgi:hypothetical protein